MLEEVTLGYTVSGEQVNLQIGVHDWEGQAALADDCLFLIHKMLDGEDAVTNIPVREILNVRYIVQNMKENLLKLEKKVDELIDENRVMAEACKAMQNAGSEMPSEYDDLLL